MIKIVKEGQIKETKIDQYQLECPECGCVFTFTTNDIEWSEKKLDGKSMIKCPHCDYQIVFKSYEHIISTEEYEEMRNYKIITLCGSTKFRDEFVEVQKKLTLEGNIVISVGVFGHAGDVFTESQKLMLDDMHKRKIDLAEEIFVINKNGYIGNSTKSEIEYAKEHNKKVRYLEGL